MPAVAGSVLVHPGDLLARLVRVAAAKAVRAERASAPHVRCRSRPTMGMPGPRLLGTVWLSGAPSSPGNEGLGVQLAPCMAWLAIAR